MRSMVEGARSREANVAADANFAAVAPSTALLRKA